MAIKKVLITGGHTQIPIDKVRVISNIFKGRTACDIANFLELVRPGRKSDSNLNQYSITVVGNPEMRDQLLISKYSDKFIPYKTYNDLYSVMERQVTDGNYDLIIHSAAVSDYYVSGVVTEPGGKYLDSSAKVSSSHETLYLELKQTRKIVDDIRSLWNFKGKLVKFKLQVGMSDEDLLDIARNSRVASNADLIVANCLEWAKDRAYIVGPNIDYSVQRSDLPRAIYAEFFK